MSLGGGAEAAASALGASAGAPAPGAAQGAGDLCRIELREEYDIVTARGITREMCGALGFAAVEQVKVATIVSELARNIIAYAGRGSIELRAIREGRKGIEVKAVDNGPGIPDLDAIMEGAYNSRSGMGIGLVGTKRLMDEFEIDSVPGRGTTIIARKFA
ncbi:MAG: anti-sigma regulatory factor [Actinobacteria bacterium]|nr:MAG: anti-sigma regulatory factor [Actinomycetota bacterium]